MFDRNPYSRSLSDLADDASITFSNYQWNDVLPFTIYRLPPDSRHHEYYNIIHDVTVKQKMAAMVRAYPNQSYIDWNMDASEYNCVYSDILDADKTHFSLIKHTGRESFLIVYNAREFTEAQVGTIVKRIFAKTSD